MPTAKLQVALIGAGAIARQQHVPAWLMVPEARIAAVAEPSPEALAALPRELGSARRVDDFRRLLDDPAIDVFDVCVPSALHAEVTIAALAAGKHVLCEKPMATSAADAAAIVQAWRSSGRKLMVGQHMRLEPSVEQLAGQLVGRPLGDVYYARGQWLRRRRLPGRPGFTTRALSGGGALYDIGVHVLDLAWWLMGCPKPTVACGAVFNRLARRTDVAGEWGEWDPAAFDVEDFAAGWLRFETGAALSLEACWLALQPEDEFYRVQLFGTQAGVVWPESILAGEEARTPWTLRLDRAQGQRGHHRVVHEFARAVLDDRPVPIPPEQSATVIAMLDTLYRSSASGRECEVPRVEPRLELHAG